MIILNYEIWLVEHRATDTEMVLKALPKPYVSLRDFYREFHYGLHLGAHKNIVTTYDVAFETAGFYVFTQEYAPLGDLTSNVSDIGIGEMHTKRVAKQVASALDYIHGKYVIWLNYMNNYFISFQFFLSLFFFFRQGFSPQRCEIGQRFSLPLRFFTREIVRLWRNTQGIQLCPTTVKMKRYFNFSGNKLRFHLLWQEWMAAIQSTGNFERQYRSNVSVSFTKFISLFR